MNTLHDILTDRADAVTDTAHHERVAAVRRRITVARRRRQAAVAGAAAAVVAIAGVAVFLPRHHEVTPTDAPSRLVGRAVPRTTTTATNAHYRYTRGYTGHDGKLSVTLPASDSSYLVRMGSSSAAGRLVLKQGSDVLWTSPAGSFGTFYAVSADVATHLQVTQSGAKDPRDVALALYTFAAPGKGWYRHNGVMYPAQIDGLGLLGASVGDAGQRSVTVRAAGGARSADFYLYCKGLPHGTFLAVSIKGERGYMAQGGCDQASADPIAAPDSASISQRVAKGRFEATLQAQDAHGKSIPIPATARIGLGIYPTAPTRQGLPETVDSGGHRWLLGRIKDGAEGIREMRTSVDGRTPTLIAFGADAPQNVRVKAWVGSDEQVGTQGGGFSSTVVATGSTVVRQQMTGPVRRGRLFIAAYTMVE